MIKYFLDKPLLDTVDLRLERKTSGASGYDLMANIGLPRVIEPRGGSTDGRWMCPTGLYLQMPLGVEAQVRTRSGLARDWGVVVLNAPGTVDSDYRGEVCVNLINLGKSEYRVMPGDRIAQIVFCPVYHSEHDDGFPVLTMAGDRLLSMERVLSRADLNSTDRGSSGFGSTGR